jgi:Fe-S-cluster-containing hydrogenase component 2
MGEIVNFSVRDGKFDVAIISSPRVGIWPSVGVRSLSLICAEMGLTVGQFGGENLTVLGVIPLTSTGGMVLIEDIQKRIHRIHARAVVRISPENTLPDPFSGWLSQGLIPLSTAELLFKENKIHWDPATVILGTGNPALNFGNRLLEAGVPSVICVETFAQWGAKRFAGWEVEKRRFEMNGGKTVEARPLQLLPKSPLIWQLRLQDNQGIRVLEGSRVVAAGPFHDFPGVREYPPGSFLFELDQTAPLLEEENPDGWAMEEERAHWLAGKIVRALVTELGPKREKLDRIFQSSRSRLKRYLKHRDFPFTPNYQGKWVSGIDALQIRSFPGTPKNKHTQKPVASVECFEEISCMLCQKACPTSAIQMNRPRTTKEVKFPILNDEACISCGLCLIACPTSSIPLIHEKPQSNSTLILPWKGRKPWKVGEFATLLNRRGESLGTARISQLLEPHKDRAASSIQPASPDSEDASAFDGSSASSLSSPAKSTQLLQLEVPSHLIWEARAIKRGRAPTTVDEAFLASVERSASVAENVEITLDGEKRLVRDKVSLSMAFFETGQSRAEDILLCQDGSCGLCHVSVDSVKKLACQTRIHKGMAIRILPSPFPPIATETQSTDNVLCPCLGITTDQIIARVKHGKLQSPEAVLSVTHVGEGKCHGQICMGAFKRLLSEQGLDFSQWIDWRFPWADWILSHN